MNVIKFALAKLKLLNIRTSMIGDFSNHSQMTSEIKHTVEQLLAREGISAEIIDLRTLSPYDWEAIAASVRKTNRALVAYEDSRSWGYGAEIAARIGDELFSELDAPVRRVAATDTFCAYQPGLEDEILPQTEDIARAVRELTEY